MRLELILHLIPILVLIFGIVALVYHNHIDQFVQLPDSQWPRGIIHPTATFRVTPEEIRTAFPDIDFVLGFDDFGYNRTAVLKTMDGFHFCISFHVQLPNPDLEIWTPCSGIFTEDVARVLRILKLDRSKLTWIKPNLI